MVQIIHHHTIILDCCALGIQSSKVSLSIHVHTVPIKSINPLNWFPILLLLKMES